MRTAKHQPLSEQQRLEIRRQLAALSDLMPELDRMESCGVQCDEYRAAARQLYADFEQLYAAYFPGKLK